MKKTQQVKKSLQAVQIARSTKKMSGTSRKLILGGTVNTTKHDTKTQKAHTDLKKNTQTGLTS